MPLYVFFFQFLYPLTYVVLILVYFYALILGFLKIVIYQFVKSSLYILDWSFFTLAYRISLGSFTSGINKVFQIIMNLIDSIFW